MQYITDKKQDMNVLLALLETNKELSTFKGVDYSKQELMAMIGKTQRQIDGYKRLHSNMKTGAMDINDFGLIRSLARLECDYFVEVENKLDTYTSSKVLSKMNNENMNSTLSLVQNLNKKIAMRSRVDFREQWIVDRTFELASIAQIEDFEIEAESVFAICCLDSVMSGKVSKKELKQAKLWRNILVEDTADLYIEASRFLKIGKKNAKVPC